ncbi:tagaturonate reductase, partial [Providencia rettgeri]|nr:tagaturonate reductase [Providencia rettgeri]
PILLSFTKDLIGNEVIPVLSQDPTELNAFASAVIDRFNNPFIEHELLSIALNSLTKFKTRLLPQLISYSNQYNQIPYCIAFSLAALIVFYRGQFNQLSIPLNDDDYLLKRFKEWDSLYDSDTRQLTQNVLAMSDLWGLNLNEIPQLQEDVCQKINAILHNGTESTLRERYKKTI